MVKLYLFAMCCDVYVSTSMCYVCVFFCVLFSLFVLCNILLMECVMQDQSELHHFPAHRLI